MAEVAPRLAERHDALLTTLPERCTREEACERARPPATPTSSAWSRLRRSASAAATATRAAPGHDARRDLAAASRTGSPYAYQGNWRDIFQNWEALCASFPAYLEATVARFVNASTADGYNPYRVTRAGFEWEVPDPDDPWAFIGYWNDHQLVYLVRLLESWRRHDPAALARALGKEGFVYADVPYRIAGFDAIVANADTISYDEECAAPSTRGSLGKGTRAASSGTARAPPPRAARREAARACARQADQPRPRGGPLADDPLAEWNDANNALVGIGASVVTLAHLSQALDLYATAFEEAQGEVTLSEEVATLWREVIATLASPPPASGLDARERRRVLEALGRAGELPERSLRRGLQRRPASACGPGTWRRACARRAPGWTTASAPTAARTGSTTATPSSPSGARARSSCGACPRCWRDRSPSSAPPSSRPRRRPASSRA